MAALVWLRWRGFLNTFRSARGRDDIEQVSRAAEMAMPAATALMVVPGGLLGAGAGMAAGRVLCDPGTLPITFLALRFLLAAVLLIPLVALLFRTAQQGQQQLTRLQLLPISTAALHHAVLLGEMADPWLLIAMPGLLMLGPGIATRGAIGSAVVATVAILLLLWLLAATLALAASATRILLDRPGRRETFVLLMLVVLCSVPLLQLHFLTGSDDPSERAVAMLDDSANDPPAWLRAVPSELVVLAIERTRAGKPTGATAPLALLLGLALAAHGLSATAFRRSLDHPVRARSRRPGARPWRRATIAMPGLPATAHAVCAAQLRTTLRSLPGRAAVLANPLAMLAMAALAGRRAEVIDAVHGAGHGATWGTLMAITCLLSIAGLMVNQLGSDGPAMLRLFLSPIDARAIVRGKFAAYAAVLALSAIIALAPLPLLVPPAPFACWAMIPVGLAAAFLLLAPACACVAILLPKARQRDTTTVSGESHELAALIAFVLPLMVATVPTVIGFFATVVLARPTVGLLLMVGWLVPCWIASARIQTLATKLLDHRRDNLAQVAEGR